MDIEVEEIGVYQAGDMSELIAAATVAEKLGRKVCVQIARQGTEIIGVRLAVVKEVAMKAVA